MDLRRTIVSWTSPAVIPSETSTTRLRPSRRLSITTTTMMTMLQWNNRVHIHQSPWPMPLLFWKPSQLLHPKRYVFPFWIIVLCLNTETHTVPVSSSHHLLISIKMLKFCTYLLGNAEVPVFSRIISNSFKEQKRSLSLSKCWII